MIARHLFPLAVAAGLLAGGTAAGAQSLAQRVAAVGTGTVRMSFALRPGVSRNGDHGNSFERSDEWEAYEPGEARVGLVALDVAGQRVTDVRFHVGGHWLAAGSDTRDLGRVAAPEAAAYLLDLAQHADPRIASRALPPAALADSAVTWPKLLELARDNNRPDRVRRDATFWLSQAAADAATKGLAELADDGNAEVRRAAVFGLSQRPHEEGLPALMRIARTHPDRRVRRDAMFWIGQSHDPRALEFLREILAGS